MLGRGEDGVAAAVLDRVAEVHHHHVVGDVADHRQVVRDEDVGQPELVLQVLQQVEDLRLHRQVERRDRLVEHQQHRMHHDGAGDRDALALAAREHVRIAVEVLGLQPDLQQHLHRPVAALAGGHRGVELQWLAEHVADLLPRVQRAVGVLEHDLHLSAQRARDAVAGDVDPLALDQQLAPGGRVDHGDDAGERRLAAAGLADDGEGAAALDPEVDPLQRPHAARAAEHAAGHVVAGDAAGLEDGRLAHSRPSAPGGKAETVGSRPPWAFSGSAESSARV